MESDFERNLSLERKHLASILKTVRRLKTVSDEELIKAQSELASVFKYDRDNTDLLEVRQLLFERAEDLSRAMKYALNQPYFTRVDFIPKDADKEIIYIGKHSVIPEKSYEPLVHDWRAPIANLYYSGQVGPMRYETPDGSVEGELTLKRNFSIIDGRLESMFDSDIVSKDAYLQSVLSAASGDRLRDIVTSIQAEQNYVIRYPLKESLIVQGVAGSGKTTIAQIGRAHV